MDEYTPFSNVRQQGGTPKEGSGAAIVSHLGSVYVGCAEQPVVSPVRDVWGTRLVITEEMDSPGDQPTCQLGYSRFSTLGSTSLVAELAREDAAPTAAKHLQFAMIAPSLIQAHLGQKADLQTRNVWRAGLRFQR